MCMVGSILHFDVLPGTGTHGHRTQSDLDVQDNMIMIIIVLLHEMVARETLYQRTDDLASRACFRDQSFRAHCTAWLLLRVP
jgi:hypothetical protein